MTTSSPLSSNQSMASSPDVNRSLKEALYETLNGILSPHHDVRIAAEERIQALEVTEDFGIHLAEFTIDPEGALAVRQLSSVLLKQYVETHWCNCSEKFRPPETTEHAKVTIKELLPHGLKESVSKVRSSVAYAISAIAHWDWPEHWPGLFDILVNYLSNDNEWAVHGAMRVLTEFSRDLTDIQLPFIAPVILSEMYRIFEDEQKYSIRIRGRAVEIFTTCAFMISAMSDYNKTVTKTLLNPVLPSFSERFVRGLQVPNGIHSDSCLKTDIIKAITLLVKRVPKQMAPWLPQILPPIWQTLTQSADIYLKTVVNGTEEVDEIVDSDGEILGFENLVFSIFEFVDALVECPKFSKTVESALTDLIYYLILFMQITEEQVRSWTANPNQFVEDEDEDTFAYSVRISAQDLLLTLCMEFEDESCPALCQAAARHVQEAETERNANNANWWKIHEACMLALGSVKDMVVEKLEAGEVVFDLTGFLQNVVIADMNSSGPPFLLGRCLWFGSRYAHFMSPPMIEQFLQATATGLQPSQLPNIRISAVRAVWGFCEHLKNSNNTQMLVSLLPTMMDNLLGMATQYSCEVLSLVMETLALVLSIDRNFTASYESKVTSLAIAVFLKYNSDPVIIMLAQDVFKELSQNPECLAPLQQRLVPTLVSILNAPVDKIPSGLHSVALDVLQTLVRYSEPPLSDTLMNTAFPAALQCILRTDDNSTMQSGGECLRTYISISPEQVCNHQDSEGHTGLWYTLQVVALLLNPSSSEYTATFVGRLITTLITKAGNILGENLDLLLKAVLSKMQRAETLSVIQSLVMVYAHLIHTQLDAVLNFLSTVPGPTGQSALQFVLTEWCSRQHLFYGAYEGKVSTVALCKLLEHGIASNDNRLNDITVKGDEVFVSEGIRTRSQTQNQSPQWTNIPLLVKIYKLLVNELSNQMEANMARNEEEETDEDSDEDDFGREDQGVPISQLLGENIYKGGMDDTGDEEEDPDALKDPVYHLNIQQYLTEFLQSFSQQPYFHAFHEHLNKQEKQVLASIGVGA
ncbi:importin-9 [Periplaneta americana]|uniref:importin-9 n=1 Tax=Periplaneta americana TaxID=6978 RepID=UPI0037E7304F